MQFSKYVFTRFNLPLPFGRAGNRDLGVVPGITNLNPAWLRERVDLFTRFCLPSMQRQADQFDQWFILFDPMTPADIVDEVCQMSKSTPVYANSQRQAVQLAMESHDFETAIFSLRLDSDDAISADFFEAVMNSLPEDKDYLRQGPLAFSFPNGSEFDTATQNFYLRFYLQNPFVVVLEEVSGISEYFGVFQTGHFGISAATRFLSVPTECPMWCINIHGGNVANKIKGVATSEDLAPRFFKTQLPGHGGV